VALIHSFDNLVEFFGTDGGLTRRISLSQIPNPDYERVIRHTAHDALLVLLTSESGSTSCRLIVLDARGSILRERELEGLQATGVAISPDARTIAAGLRNSRISEDGVVWMISTEMKPEGGGMEEWRSGGVLAESIVGSFSRGSFSADGSTFLGRTNASVIEVDIVAGVKRWEMRAPAGRLVVDAVLGANGASVLLADAPTLEKGTWIHRRPVMRVVAGDGTVVSERSVPSMGFSKARLVPRAGTTVVDFDGVVY
jgi:outer membrane protein assembly factor BamB